MRRLFEATSDSQGENTHTHTHTHAHLQSLSSALPLKFMSEAGLIHSHKSDTKGHHVSCHKATSLCAADGLWPPSLLFVFTTITDFLTWDEEHGTNTFCSFVRPRLRGWTVRRCHWWNRRVETNVPKLVLARGCDSLVPRVRPPPLASPGC